MVHSQCFHIVRLSSIRFLTFVAHKRYTRIIDGNREENVSATIRRDIIMGDRSNINFISDTADNGDYIGLNLYSHWGGRGDQAHALQPVSYTHL